MTICLQRKYLYFFELDRHNTYACAHRICRFAANSCPSLQNVILSAEAPFYSPVSLQDRKFMPPRFGRKICRHPLCLTDIACLSDCHRFQEAALCDGAARQDGLLLLDRLRLVGRQDPPGAAPGVGGRGRHHHPPKEVVARG